MKRHPVDTPQAAGYFRGEISFDAPSLQGHRFPLVEIQGRQSGPRLCVMAGVHVNEVSSIEAAIRLPTHFLPDTLRGTLSLIPVINQPGFYEYTQYNCPVDGKNILFHFPGRPGGTFSEALCHALLFEWAQNADVLVDMHGGDLRENVSKFVMYQRTGQPDTDRRHEALARCFDADILQPPQQTAAFSRDGLLLAPLLILEQFEEPVMLQPPDEARAVRSLTCRDPP